MSRLAKHMGLKRGKRKVSTFWSKLGQLLSAFVAILGIIYGFAPAVFANLPFLPTLLSAVGSIALGLAVVLIIAYVCIAIDYFVY